MPLWASVAPLENLGLNERMWQWCMNGRLSTMAKLVSAALVLPPEMLLHLYHVTLSLGLEGDTAHSGIFGQKNVLCSLSLSHSLLP